jgi:F-type H+-transporting ATPase subunit a
MKLRTLVLVGAALVAPLATPAAPLGAQQAHGAPPAAADSTANRGAAAVNAEINRSLTGSPQGAHGGAASPEQHGTGGGGDIIMPHITDSRHLEIPWPSSHLAREVTLPRWAPLHLGALTVDLSPTKHVVMLLLAAVLCAATLITAAAAHRRHHHAVGRPRGFAAGIESVVLFVRNEVILKNVGPHGEGFAPFLLTLFFFILFANVLGLIPYGSTATGNIAVTATLALISFVVIEIAGMRALGSGYVGTIVYWPSDMKFGLMKIFLALILTPVELLGKFTKPFALAIRLFANMTAGHVIVLAFIGMIFTFQSWLVAPAPLLMALAIMLLEVFVALLQAYIFTLLVSTFIGQLREAHH